MDFLLGKQTREVFSGNPLPPSTIETEQLVAAEILENINARREKQAVVVEKRRVALELKENARLAKIAEAEAAEKRKRPVITSGTLAAGSYHQFLEDNPHASERAKADWFARNTE